MLKTSGWILTAGLILGGGARAFGQMGFPGGPQSAGPAGQMPPEMVAMQKAQDRLMKEEAPGLYAFQKKLRGIETKIEEAAASFANKEIDKETAKDKMLPLMKQEQKIKNDPEFLVEERLAQVYFSSPEFRAKMEKIMRALAAKQKAKR